MGECIPVLTLVDQKKTALVRRKRQQLPKISGFLISRANLMRGVSALAKETKTLQNKRVKKERSGAGLRVRLYRYIGCDIINQVGVITQIR